jgi:hypothetical protein
MIIFLNNQSLLLKHERISRKQGANVAHFAENVSALVTHSPFVILNAAQQEASQTTDMTGAE